jgi:hypothetical protein
VDRSQEERLHREGDVCNVSYDHDTPSRYCNGWNELVAALDAAAATCLGTEHVIE